MLILDLWGISFHPVVVVGLGNDLLFNFILVHCADLNKMLMFLKWTSVELSKMAKFEFLSSIFYVK